MDKKWNYLETLWVGILLGLGMAAGVEAGRELETLRHACEVAYQSARTPADTLAVVQSTDCKLPESTT